MIQTFSRGIRNIEFLSEFLSEEISKFGPLDFSKGRSWTNVEPPESNRCSAVIGWGHKPTADVARAYAHRNKVPYLALEDGFYRSLRLGAEGAQPLSLTVDPIGVYYDAEVPSALEGLLNDWSSWYTPDVAREAEVALTIIKSADLSKYNASPTFTEEACREFKKRFNVPDGTRMVLVVDQTVGDASVRLGGADESCFERMLDAARKEANAVVFVKTHPDVIADKKKGYFTQVPEDVRLVTENWAPLSFMSFFDSVYVVTSQMGFEALLIGKKVHVYGVPFYAGWGLTEDHSSSQQARAAFRRRQARPPLKALFAALVIKLSRYVNPISGRRVTLLESLDLLAAQRLANERNRGRHVCIGFRRWKQPHVAAFLSGTDSTVEFVKDVEIGLARAQSIGAEIVMWSSKCTDELVERCRKLGLRLTRTEDGFIRSVGLGSDYNYPYSLVLDSEGIYFDPARASRLEGILQTIKEHPNHDLLVARASKLRTHITMNRLSKYNVGRLDVPIPDWAERAKGRRVILVPGQVDDDASVRRGGGDVQSNRQLLKLVRAENPDAFVVYKPHPDVESGNRIGKVPTEELVLWADAVARNVALESLWPYVSEVHTLTSLSGFEALCRGKKVTTYGKPFYAGWGLTTDKHVSVKSASPLLLDELVAAALLLYPSYWDWGTSQFCRPEDVCFRLGQGVQPEVALWIKVCRIIRNVKNLFKS